MTSNSAKKKSSGSDGKKRRSIEVNLHGKDGFTAVHHFSSPGSGEYHEPETVPFKNHGELMDHLHEHLKSSGEKVGAGDCPCEGCAGGSEKDDDEKGEKESSPASKGSGKNKGGLGRLSKN